MRGVVHLSGLDGGGEEALTSEELTSEGLFGDTEHGCASALALTQGLLDADAAPSAGMWLVTRGAQAVTREPGGVLAGAALWGLGRTVGLEAPQLGARLLDLDPAGEPDAGALVGELLYPDRETQVAHRAGVRHAARLVRGVTCAGRSGAVGAVRGQAARGRHVPGDGRSRWGWARGGGMACGPWRGGGRAQRAPRAGPGGGGGGRGAPRARGDGGGRDCRRVGRGGGGGDAVAHRGGSAAAGRCDSQRGGAVGRGAGEPGLGAVRAGVGAEDGGGVASAPCDARIGA